MIDSLRKAFSAYTKRPFLFVWGSLMYVFMLIIFFFAALAFLLAYFLFLSVIGQPFDLKSIPTLVVLGIIGLVFKFFASGLNASLARTYHSALWKQKTTITAFYTYALERSLQNFAILVIRDVFWLLLAGPFIAAYVFFLSTIQYMDVLIGLIVATITFVIHMLFTPALLSSGAFTTGLYSSLLHGLNLLKRKHVMFVGLYIIFAVFWLLNFVPFVQLVTIFFLYPIAYSALILMMENYGKGTSRSKKKQEEE